MRGNGAAKNAAGIVTLPALTLNKGGHKMTLDQALHTADEMKPNQVERARKIDWISTLDKRIFRDVMCAHEKDGSVPDTFAGYDQSTAPDTELLAKAPYDEIYRFYLEMQIDLANQEYEKYNNSAVLYANAWGQFARAYHREHKPIESKGAVWRF